MKSMINNYSYRWINYWHNRIDDDESFLSSKISNIRLDDNDDDDLEFPTYDNDSPYDFRREVEYKHFIEIANAA